VRLPDDVRRALEARLAVCRVTSGKVQAVLDRVTSDSRLHGTLIYWGAGATGRWAGRGFQPQNLPRPTRGLPADVWDREAPKVARDIGASLADVLGSMLRGVLVAPRLLAMCDYSAVEARVILWLAGDEEHLDVYRRGDDPYMRMAKLLGVNRQTAKVTCLASQYQGGPGAFDVWAKTYAIDTANLDVAGIVNGWRDDHPLIAGTRRRDKRGRDILWTTPDGRVVVTRKGGLWKACKAAAYEAIRGDGARYNGALCANGRISYLMADGHLICRLPSGRDLVYREADIRTWPNRWGEETPALTYLSSQRGQRVATYGGELAAHCTQAVARDLMADALVKCEAEGIRVVLTVHDEIIAEVVTESDLAKLEAIMLDTPEWAAGLPVAVEGRTDTRYGK